MLSSVTFSVGLWGGSTSGRHGRLGKVTPTQGSLADGVRPNKHTHTHTHTYTHRNTHTHTETPHTRSQSVADPQPADMWCSNTRCEWAPLARLKKKKEHTSDDAHTHVHALQCTHLTLVATDRGEEEEVEDVEMVEEEGGEREKDRERERERGVASPR